MESVVKLNWIKKKFLHDRSQTVVVDGVTSDYISVDSGVQGTVLEPSLLLFYINDMLHGLKSTVRLFADDTIAYLTITFENDALALQTDLNKLGIWEKKWKMEFHPGKCNALTISRKPNPIKYSYSSIRWKRQISGLSNFIRPSLDQTHQLNMRQSKQDTRIPTT